MRSLGRSIFVFQILWVAICSTTSLPFAVAQVSVDSTGLVATADGVSSSGSETIPLEPMALRLTLTASAEDRDGESALRTLRDHTQRVEKELVFLGAAKESIKILEPTVSAAIPGVSNFEQARKQSRQQTMQMRVMNGAGGLVLGANQGGNQGNVDELEEADMPHVYTATCSVIADWKISGPVDDKIRLMPSNLRRSILEKDLQGRRYTEKLTPQEQQMILSIAGNNVYHPFVSSFDGSPVLNDPKCRFRYIAKISDETLQIAFETAFQKARAEAEKMAKTASADIHGTRSIRKVERGIIAQPEITQVPYAYVVPTNAGIPETKRHIADDEREIVDINNPTIVVQVFTTFKLD